MTQIRCKRCGIVKLTVNSNDPEFIKRMEDEMGTCWYCTRNTDLEKRYGSSEEFLDTEKESENES
jgi:hypothetical protein